MSSSTSIPVLALMEASWVTGPAKNLIGFCRWMQSPEGQKILPLSIHLATFSRPGEKRNLFVEAARSQGIPVHVIPESGRFDRSVVGRIQVLVDQLQPRVVQTHNVKSHFLLKASGAARQRPWIAFHHGYTATTATMLLYNQLDRWSLRSAGRVVTVCQAFAPQLTACGVAPERIRILHNSVTPFAPVEPENLAAIRRELELPEGIPVILCVGRFSAEKGQLDLLHALGQLQGSGQTAWKAVLVGSGPDRPALEELIRHYRLQQQVRFADFRADPAPLFFLADVFVLPSHSEGSSNVLLEAMATGLPVAATAVGGNPEIVQDGETALLTPSRQPSALAGALGRLLQDGSLRRQLGSKAQLHAATVFSPEQYRRTLVDIYRGVLTPR